MSSPAPRRSPVSLRMIGWVLGMIAAFAITYFSLPKKSLNGPGGPIKLNTNQGGASSSLCEKKLVKWIQSVNPERLQFDTDIESRVLELNRYWDSCGPKGVEPIVSDKTPIEVALVGDDRDRALSPRFQRRDIEHIRQSLLLSQIAIRISEEHKLELDRTMAAFEVIALQLQPRAAELATDRPLTPFECLLIGQATPAERAWIFAEIVRQLRLDAVVLTTDDTALAPLIGVVIEQNVLLFDSLTGLPVPAAGESQRSSAYQVPASLKDALANDSILRQLDLEGSPFPWTAEKLKSATIGLVGTSCTWAPRSAELQFQWPSSQSCLIYDGLGASSTARVGLVDRVHTVMAPLGYASERIRVWNFPEQQCVKYDTLGAESASFMAPVVSVMSGPRSFVETQDPVTNAWSVVAQRSKRPLQQARVQQLLRHHVEAIGGYLPMLRVHRATPKNVSIDSTIQAVIDQNRTVADKAMYWMASTQYENADFDACQSTLKMYGREFPLGEMREAATIRLAACLAKSQQPAEAADLLQGYGPGPNLLHRTLVARRLTELAGASAPAPTVPPADAPPAPEAPTTETPVVEPSTEAVPPAPPQAESL